MPDHLLYRNNHEIHPKFNNLLQKLFEIEMKQHKMVPTFNPTLIQRASCLLGKSRDHICESRNCANRMKNKRVVSNRGSIFKSISPYQNRTLYFVIYFLELNVIKLYHSQLSRLYFNQNRILPELFQSTERGMLNNISPVSKYMQIVWEP